MPSTDAGSSPETGNGRPSPEPAVRRGLRDRPLGKLLLLLAVLLAALVASRSCARQAHEITEDEAVALAKEHASFVPCNQEGCMQVRALNQGIPVRLVWIVGLAERLGPDGTPLRYENFEIDASTGEVTRRG